MVAAELGPAEAVVAAGPGEVAVEEEADGVEFEPHAPTIAATTAAAIVTGSAFDLVILMMMLPPYDWGVHGEKQIPNSHETTKLTDIGLRNGKYAAMKTHA